MTSSSSFLLVCGTCALLLTLLFFWTSLDYGMDGVSQLHTTALNGPEELNKNDVNLTLPAKTTAATDGFGQTSSPGPEPSPLLNTSSITKQVTPLEPLLFQCRLPAKDPWNNEILPFLNPLDPGPLSKCKPSFEEVTQFECADGSTCRQLSIRQKFVKNVKNCDFRCLTSVSDHKFKTERWIELKEPVQPRCDVFEVKCDLKKPAGSKYTNIYYQIFRDTTGEKEGNSSETTPQNNSGFGVHIIVLDSVSRSQFFRSMQKTTYLLREEFEAIPFDYLNKVGENSKPNGYAFLMGKQMRTIPRSPINSKPVPPDTGWEGICSRPLDNETSFAGFLFQQAGYKTLLAEDWAAGVFNWPNCKGFTSTPMDHYMRPFQLRLSQKAGKGKNLVYDKFNAKRCLEAHSHLLSYLRQFIEVYDDVGKKFSIIWISDLAHDHPNHLYHADQQFYRLFRDLQSKLDNSFLFVMGDHGNRFGKLRATHTGTMEDNNPALFMVLPRQLRHNPVLRAILERNAKKLISHYDLYATLLEISQMEGEWRADYRPEQKGQHGWSLMHDLQPRDCPTLRIPFDYCQCEWNYTSIISDHLAHQLVWAAVDKLNQDLAGANLTDCENLTPDADMSKIKIERFDERPLLLEPKDDSIATYKVTFETQPGGGQFSGFVEAKTNAKEEGGEEYEVVKIVSDTFSRLNAHGDQSKCAINQPKVRPYCYCKKTLIGKVWSKVVVGGS